MAALAISDTDLNRAYFGTDTQRLQTVGGRVHRGHARVADHERAQQQRSPRCNGVRGDSSLLLATSALDMGPITAGWR